MVCAEFLLDDMLVAENMPIQEDNDFPMLVSERSSPIMSPKGTRLNSIFSSSDLDADIGDQHDQSGGLRLFKT